MTTAAKINDHADIFAALSAVNLACLATEKIADRAATGDRDLEGELADLILHLRAIVRQLDRAIG